MDGTRGTDGGARQLALAALLASDGAERTVYRDDRFERTLRSAVVDGGWRLEAIRDRLTLADGALLEHAALTLTPPAPAPAPALILDGVSALDADERAGLVAHGPGSLLWIPEPPVVRRWDAARRHILDELPLPLRPERSTSPPSWRLDLGDTPLAGPLELAVVRADGDLASALVRELGAWSPIERRRWSFVRHFDYAGPRDVWRCLAGGSVHEQTAWHAGGRSRNEQAGRVLYELLGLLGVATGKSLYAALQELVAYSVLLALDVDDRWRHGNWSDLDETHTRLQLDGIALLAAHHAVSGKAIFRERADRALDYLVGIADRLAPDELWFLHDTLELDLASARRVYAMRPSTAFGKSPGSTLCLNTQLDTLAALARRGAADAGAPDHAPYVQGLGATARVLAARPQERWFALLSGLRDRALRAQRPAADGASRDGGVWSLVERGARRLLRRSKERWPRLVLPGGFIERDLVSAAFSDFYHVQNVKDLMVLERLAPADWMRPLIDDGVAWLLDQDLAQLVARHRGSTSLLAVLGMALARQPGRDDILARLVAGACRLHEAGIGLPVDLVTCTMPPAAFSGLADLDPRLVPVGGGAAGLLVINPSADPIDSVPPRGSRRRAPR